VRRTVIFLLALMASALFAMYVDGRFFASDLELDIAEPSITETQISAALESPIEKPLELVDGPGIERESITPVAEPELDSRSNENHNASYRCVAKAEQIDYKKVGQIYKWTDSAGKTRFSDKEPGGGSAEVVNAGKGAKQFFDVNVTYPTGNIPTNIAGAIKRKTKGVYRIYEQLLPTELLAKSQIDVFVYSNKQAYEAEKYSIAPTIGAADGFYTPNGNKAYVIYKGNSARTERVAIHESAHVVHAHNFGRPPRWFNEGMAEVLEYISVSGYSMTLHLNKDWTDRLGKTMAIMPLKKLLSSTHQDWSGDDRNIYYANAWAFSHFMMQHNNRGYMEQFLTLMVADKCSVPDSVNFFADSYPGGLDNLESKWIRWVNSKNKVPITL
jgi:hypothetical protein